MNNIPSSNDTYQVHVYTCPAHFPFSFARHPWVVCVSGNTINRFEVLKGMSKRSEHYGYVHRNHYETATQGINKKCCRNKYEEGTLLASVTGGENSLAHKMYSFIHRESPTYPHKDRYRIYPGPNSNSYVGWILRSFPEANITLPWNCFGKRYK
jgi:hypothetical protein